MSPATDDGFWNIGDPFTFSSIYLYVGYYEADGHLFVVFEWDAGDEAIIASQTALVASSGYPENYADLPPLVTDPLALCFAAGTLIATPAGEIAVERLSIGDLITTSDGRAVPVKWLGRQTLAPRFARLRLIRVAAGALGADLPAHDLTLTADHALMIEGLLVNAGALVNGTTVTEVPLADLPERVTVYHVETERHDVILAEGMPAETFIDYAGRQAFDNHADYVALYGEDRTLAENPAPRVTSARHLPSALKARLQALRAA